MCARLSFVPACLIKFLPVNCADDNTFDGCHFFNNSWGIFTDKMANVYVRNSRFDSNGRSFAVKSGPAVNMYASGDIMLAPSAGNSVRRCVSVNAGGTFVSSPHHTSVNPATIEGCVIDSWRGAAAVSYQLRGPLLLLDNAFTNGSNKVWEQPAGTPCHPYKCGTTDGVCRSTPCPQPMDYSPWCEKRLLLRNFVRKIIILPRQARDKHRKSWKSRRLSQEADQRHRSLCGQYCGRRSCHIV